jgi:hypothetical protein
MTSTCIKALTPNFPFASLFFMRLFRSFLRAVHCMRIDGARSTTAISETVPVDLESLCSDTSYQRQAKMRSDGRGGFTASSAMPVRMAIPMC